MKKLILIASLLIVGCSNETQLSCKEEVIAFKGEIYDGEDTSDSPFPIVLNKSFFSKTIKVKNRDPVRYTESEDVYKFVSNSVIGKTTSTLNRNTLVYIEWKDYSERLTPLTGQSSFTVYDCKVIERI